MPHLLLKLFIRYRQSKNTLTAIPPQIMEKNMTTVIHLFFVTQMPKSDLWAIIPAPKPPVKARIKSIVVTSASIWNTAPKATVAKVAASVAKAINEKLRILRVSETEAVIPLMAVRAVIVKQTPQKRAVRFAALSPLWVN